MLTAPRDQVRRAAAEIRFVSCPVCGQPGDVVAQAQPLTQGRVAGQQIEVRRASLPTRFQKANRSFLSAAGGDDMQTSGHRAQGATIEHVYLHALARHTGMFAG